MAQRKNPVKPKQYSVDPVTKEITTAPSDSLATNIPPVQQTQRMSWGAMKRYFLEDRDKE